MNLGTPSAWSLTGVIPPSITAPSGRKRYMSNIFSDAIEFTKEKAQLRTLHWTNTSSGIMCRIGFHPIFNHFVANHSTHCNGLQRFAVAWICFRIRARWSRFRGKLLGAVFHWDEWHSLHQAKNPTGFCGDRNAQKRVTKVLTASLERQAQINCRGNSFSNQVFFPGGNSQMCT